jgi:hypothetical protein
MEIIIYLLLVVFGIGLLARLSWAFFRVHFWGGDLGIAVKNKLPLWLQKGIDLLIEKPENLSTFGVFLMFIWILIIFLNVLLLAQVFELFFDSGSRILFPLVGSYTVVPLIMGVLLAFSQTAFKIIFDRGESKGIKVLLAVIICVAVLTEGGLSAFRAWMLTIGKEAVSPSLWDMIMLRGGPILAGFLGLIVPLAEIFTGAIAFKEGVEPLVETLTRWVGGLLILFMTAIVWWIFFIPEIIVLPDSIAFLRDKFRKVMNGSNELKIKSDTLKEEVSRLGRMPKDFQTFIKETEGLENIIIERGGKWEKNSDELELKINHAGSLSDFESLKRKEFRSLQALMFKDFKETLIKINQLYDAIKIECGNIRIWNKKVQRCTDQLNNYVLDGESFKATYDNLRNQAEEINLCFGEQNSFKPDSLTQPQVVQLTQLKNKAMNESNAVERDRALKEMQGCLKVTTEIKDLSNKVKGILATIDQLKTGIPGTVLLTPTKTEENDLRTKVLQIENEITSNQKVRKQRYGDLERDMKSKIKEVKQDMPWYRRFFIFISFLIFLPLIGGCNNLSEQIKKADTHRFVIVLLDETSSFSTKNGEGVQFWSEVIPWVDKIVNKLQPGDGFGVIGIDAKGFETEDIRINLEVLNEGQLKAQQQKLNLRNQVKTLSRREGAKATDILGALSHAAYLLNNQDKKFKGEIVIFSDMQQTARRNVKEPEYRFPEGTLGYCFYVNATGEGNWDKLTNEWIPIFERLNLNVSRKDGKLHFYQRGEMQIGFINTFGIRN